MAGSNPRVYAQDNRKSRSPDNHKKDNEDNEHSKCGECRRKVADGEEGILCDECGYWYHIRCGKLAKKIYELIIKHKELEWRCPNCKVEALKMKEKMNKLVEENKLLVDRLQILDTKKRSQRKYREMGIELDLF